MSCPIDIVHSGVSLSPLSLFTLLTTLTTNIHEHHLSFRHNEHEFPIDFLPSMAVLTPDEMELRTKQPSSFCHFHGSNDYGFRAWLSACSSDQIDMILHARNASFTLKQDYDTFQLESQELDFIKIFDSLNIEFRLVHLKVFESLSESGIDYTTNRTMMNTFVKYLQTWYKGAPFDNANLL
ncbi:hypothetical protein PENTCL1PPCAC_705, partial [Pristionchus entomophagus]